MRIRDLALAVVLAAVWLGPTTAPLTAQFEVVPWNEGCGDGGWGDRDRHCEMREATLPSTGEVSVDASPNGGIVVKGWERGEVRLRAKVSAHARSEEEARELASRIEVSTGPVIRASGPSGGEDEGWSVSFELMVPRRHDLALESVNGGIHIEDVEGRIEFETRNGGVHLSGLAGDVRGRTANGGVHVRLEGSEWLGEGLDVQTSNGGVEMLVPADYNAHLETGTVNGRLRVDFPVTVEGELGRRVAVDLGAGGAPLRVETTNGGVRILRL